MTYQEAEDFLTFELQNYRRSGELTGFAVFAKNRFSQASPSKQLPSRSKILRFLNSIGNPHAPIGIHYVHVAGTNGKGTVSHAIAALSSSAGIKTGLYTSPHYASYRERIKINGTYISEAEVISFVEQYQGALLELEMSYFEATAALAFWYFKKQNVELAVLEVGLGGTWDASNVIVPLISVITNIGYDHQEVLGNTLSQIAGEKAGIVKAYTPVLVGQIHEETLPVFAGLAAGYKAPLYLAEKLTDIAKRGDYFEAQFARSINQVVNDKALRFTTDLQGPFVQANLRTALTAFQLIFPALAELRPEGFLSIGQAVNGLASLASYGYMGRYQILATKPTVICDAGHNDEAWAEVIPRVVEQAKNALLHVVCGFKKGKNIESFFRLFSPQTSFYLCEASALPLAIKDFSKSVPSPSFVLEQPSVANAIALALEKASDNDFIFIGGSSYVVGDAIAYFQQNE